MHFGGREMPRKLVLLSFLLLGLFIPGCKSADSNFYDFKSADPNFYDFKSADSKFYDFNALSQQGRI